MGGGVCEHSGVIGRIIFKIGLKLELRAWTGLILIGIKTSRTCYLETLLTYKAMYLLTLHLCDFHERQFVDFPLLLQSAAIYYTDFRANHNETRITSLQN